MNKRLMLSELKSHLGYVKDNEFANFLGIKPNSLASWYSRNTFDAELIYSKCDFVNPGWLLSGRGDMILQNINRQHSEKESDYSLLLELLKHKDAEIRNLSEEIGSLKERLKLKFKDAGYHSTSIASEP